jgi:hypothetical protein
MPKRSELSGFIDPYRITCCRDGCRRQGQRGLLIGVGIAQQRVRAGHGGAICSTAPRASAPVVPRLFWGTPPGNQFPKSLIVRAQWWAHKGSNLGPLPCEGNALPLSYAPGRRIWRPEPAITKREAGVSSGASIIGGGIVPRMLRIAPRSGVMRR